MISFQHPLKTALEAAEAGAAILMEGYGQNRPEVHYKGRIDLVTEFDLRSEEAVRKIILRDWPEHAIIGEEGGLHGRKLSAYKWYIDPLDGTTNFAHGHPFFAVSIGLWGPDAQGVERPLAGVINAPALGELYWGSHGCGAFGRRHLHGRGYVEKKLKISQTDELGKSMLVTGFPYDIYERGDELIHPFGRLVMVARSVRRAGSAALDMAYVAGGIADGFWETGLKPWDIAAGLLLLNEAGGKYSNYHGDEYIFGQSTDLLASNSLIHDEIIKYLEDH